MTADIVNLRRARKAKARTEREREAEANRAVHGRTKSEKAADKAQRELASRSLDAHKRDRDGTS